MTRMVHSTVCQTGWGWETNKIKLKKMQRHSWTATQALARAERGQGVDTCSAGEAALGEAPRAATVAGQAHGRDRGDQGQAHQAQQRGLVGPERPKARRRPERGPGAEAAEQRPQAAASGAEPAGPAPRVLLPDRGPALRMPVPQPLVRCALVTGGVEVERVRCGI